MIFVTVGTQLPFQRLIGSVDQWAVDANEEVFAQIGPDTSEYLNIKTASFLSPKQTRQKMEESDIIVAHAGMGSILSALEMGKQIVIFPRRFDLGEHRNDHQMATARSFEGRSQVHVAYDEKGLRNALSMRSRFVGGDPISPYAPAGFIEELRRLIKS